MTPQRIAVKLFATTQPDEGVDTGPLYLQQGGVPIESTDTMASLYFDKLYPMGVEGVVDTVAAIAAGTATLTPQSAEGASTQGLVDEGVAQIDLGADLEAVDGLIRGCDPSPGAWLELDGAPVRLFGCSVESRGDRGEPPGTVLGLDAEGLVLAVRGGSLRIRKVRCDGAKKVPAQESGLAPGQRLVSSL